VRQLIEHLAGADPLRRDVAVARLAVIGPRGVRLLLDQLARSDVPAARAAILRALEAIHDARALPRAIELIDDPDMDVATAAVALLRGFLRSSEARLGDAAFERLTGVVLDTARPEPVRTAALEALADLPGATLSEVLRQLRTDPSAAIRQAASQPSGGARPRTLAEIAGGARCPAPGELRATIAAAGPDVPLPVLARLLDLIHEREAAETATGRRTEWQAARGALHQALAARGSRLAVYDLRESLAVVPGPLPVGFIAALERVGDASCLEPIAGAYLRASRAGDDWWVEHLERAFHAVVKRERLTHRSAAVKRAFTRWPEAADGLRPGLTRKSR
jgi:hypothetical protein